MDGCACCRYKASSIVVIRRNKLRVSYRNKTMSPSFLKSNQLYERALKTIPQGSQTYSKSAENFVLGSFPLFIDSGKGGRVTDVDGNEFIDFILALCPIILGYGDQDVDIAIKNQLDKGIIFSLASPLEAVLSEKLTTLIPCAEKVRFAKNGSDVTAGAVRLARAHTGRDKVAICGYHGWHDWYIGTTAKGLGVPQAVKELSYTFSWNQPDTLRALLEKHPDGFAAIILEPSGPEPPTIDFLREVRELADTFKAVLIFDEIVTGFRMHIGGAQSEYGIIPDLACFGKSMANGMPLSALVGRENIMCLMDKVFVSGTFGGELLSIAASIATIDKLISSKALPKIRSFGNRIKYELNLIFKMQSIDNYLHIGGEDWRPVLKINNVDVHKQLVINILRNELAKNGLIFGSGFNICLAHVQEGEALINKTVNAWDKAVALLGDALKSENPTGFVDGKIVNDIFQVR